MRAARLLAILPAGLAAALLLAAWLIPPVLDWNRYRDGIAVLASTTLGRPVRIDGPVTLRLLPQPVLTARNVALEGPPGGLLATAAELRLRVGLGPLLAGQVDAQELVLFGLDARLPWPPASATAALRAPAWLSGLSARVENGRLALGDAVVTGIAATLTNRDDTGSWNAAGTGTLAGRRLHFTARLGRPGSDGVAGIDLTLDGQGPLAGTGLAVSGLIAADGEVSGRAGLRGPDLSLLLPGPAVPFRAEGRLRLAGGLAFVDELAGEIAGSPAQGAVSLRLEPQPRLDMALAASRLDLDAWLPPLLRGAALAAALPIGIDLSAEAAQLAGGTLRTLRVAVDIGGGTLTLREGRATLPGDAALSLQGRVQPPDGAGRPLTFDGTASLTAPALRTTLAWAQAAGLGRIEALPTGMLRSADLRARVVAGTDQVALDRIEGSLDGDGISGSFTLRPGPRPGINARLAVPRLDLAHFLPEGDAGFRPGLLATLAAGLGGVEADLRVEAAEAVLPGLLATPFVVDVAIEPARAVLRRLEWQSDGVQLTASGVLAEGGRIIDGRMDLRAPDAARLTGWLPAWANPAAPFWRGPAQLAATAGGTAEAMIVRLAAELADLRLEAQPTLDLNARRATGPLMLRHPGAPRLAELLGFGGTVAWLGDGSLGVIAQISASPERVAAESFELSAGGLRAAGALALDLGEAPQLTGRISAETLPLPLPYARAPEPLPLGWLGAGRAQLRVEAGELMLGASRLLGQARANVTMAAGVLRLDDVGGRMEGGTVSGRMVLDGSGPVPAATLELSLTDAKPEAPLLDQPLDTHAGTLDATVSLSATGHSPATLLATLGGGLRVRQRDGVFTGLALPQLGEALREDDVRAALAGGETPFSQLDIEARISAGVLTAMEGAGFAAASGRVGLAGTIDLPGGTADIRLTIRPDLPDQPQLGLRLTGRADALVRTPELADLTRWRAARGE